MHIPHGKVILTLVVVAAILLVFKPWESVSHLVNESPALVLLAVAGLLTNMVLNAFVYATQLRPIRAIFFSRVLETVMKSWVVESLMPGKLGSFAAAWFWQKDGLTLGQGAAVVIAYRVSLGLGAILIGLWGVLAFFPVLSGDGAILVVPAVAVAALVFAAAFWGANIRKLLPETLRNKLQGFSTVLRGFIRFPLRGIALFVFAVFQLAVASFFFYLMFLMAGYDVGFFPILAASSLVQLASLIPLSINGIGIREGLMAILLEMVGIPIPVTILVSGINTAAGYVLAFLFSLHWAKDLKNIRKEINLFKKD